MLNDLRSAVRTLSRAPVVTLLAVVSLGLGIGANAAIFSIFNQAFLRPLPVPAPEQLVTFVSPGRKSGRVSAGNAGNSDAVFSYPMFRDLERVQTAFTGIAAHRALAINLAFGSETSNEQGMLVSGSYFPVLGIQPAIGRLLTPDDDRTPGAHHVVVLSYQYWQRRFGGDPSVQNRPITINGQPMTIVGVAPRGFQGTTLEEQPTLFVPLSMSAALNSDWTNFEDRRDYWLYLFARLRPGMSSPAATASINGPYHSITLDVEMPLLKGSTDRAREAYGKRELLLQPGSRGEQPYRTELTPVFLMLFAVTGAVVLIACANIANLLLARAVYRAGEIAIRLSLGARRTQVVAQLLMESCLVGCLGGIAGLLFARWTLSLLSGSFPEAADSYFLFRMDPAQLLFIVMLSLITGLLFGLFPAVHGTRLNVVSALKAQTGMPSGTRAASRFRSSLVSAQIALAMALLVVAVLFAQSLYNISRVELGMHVSQVATFHISPALNGYSPERSRAIFERVEDEIAAAPGVASVAASSTALLNGDDSATNVTVEGFIAAPDADKDAFYSNVGPGFFRTMGIPLVAGREFTAQDVGVAPTVAIVNEAFAKKFNMGREVVGRHMRRGGSRAVLDLEIVGLVRDAKYSRVKDHAPPQFFMPYRQVAGLAAMTFYVRSAGKPDDVPATVRRVMTGIDRQLPVDSLRTMDEQILKGSTVDRLLGRLAGAFAALAVFLAGIGLYGVLAYTVAQRTREIGLRMALGADRGDVRRFVLSHIGRLLPAGIAIGVLAAIGLGRLAGSLLFGVQGTSPGVIAAAGIGVTVVALLAAIVPAYRAMRVDPIRALRYD